MSRRRAGYQTEFSSNQVGEFGVATSGGVWVAAGDSAGQIAFSLPHWKWDLLSALVFVATPQKAEGTPTFKLFPRIQADSFAGSRLNPTW